MTNSFRQTRYASLPLQDVVCLCAGPSNDEAWEELVLRVRQPIGAAVRRTASVWGEPSPSLVDDLIQITYLKLWEGGCSMMHAFASEHPDALLGYLMKIASNATHDHFKHRHSQASGGNTIHVSTSDVDPAAGRHVHGTEEQVGYEILVQQIDDILRTGLDGPDQERDRIIFWLYFRQGMTTAEIALVPTIGLSAKGVGSVIERLKQLVRKQIVGSRAESEAKEPENSYELDGETDLAAPDR